jgi:hypothetical protein
MAAAKSDVPPSKKMRSESCGNPPPMRTGPFHHGHFHTGEQQPPSRMESAFLRRLQTDAVEQYRRNYQRFRKGKPHGAEGERPDPQKCVVEVRHSLFIK